MAPRILARFMIWMILLVACLPVHGMERIQLAPGELQAITLSERVTWHLSRRGVVELSQEQEGVWHVVALRSGLVVARAKTASGRELGQYMIQVEKKDQRHAGLLQKEPWAAWICQMPKISCDHQRQQVAGQLNDHVLFYQISSLCEKHQPCIFALSLTDQARQELREESLYHQGIYDLVIRSSGKVQLRLDCGYWSKANWQEFIKHSPIPRKFWQWSCLEEQEAFRLEVRAYMIDQHSFQKNHPQSFIDGLEWQKFLARQSDFVKSYALNEVIGEPVAQVTMGQPVEIHHGMEIPVISSAADAQEYWRKIGFVLKANIKVRKNERVRADIEFALSQPGRDRQLTSSHLHTSVWLSLGEEKLVGSLDSSTILSQEQEHFFLASVPIIGPLFRNQQKSQGRARVVLLLRLTNTGS